MHLSIDADRPIADVVASLVTALRARGLAIARSIALPRGPTGREAYVVELKDPLPGVPHERADADTRTTGMTGTSSGRPADDAAGDAFPISVFEVGPGRCRISTLHPTTFVDLLGHPEVAPAALALEKSLHDALTEAAGRAPPEP